MVIRIATPLTISLFYTAIPLMKHRKFLLKDLKTKFECMSFENVTSGLIHTKSYTESGKDPSKKSGKAEKIKVKMPGFISPENMNEEGYFTQRAKEQLEELKKRLEKPSLTGPEKR